ncbi:MAG TPA: ABC transporter permease [Planctomycetota bacterium]
MLKRFLSDYGILFALLALGVWFSWATLAEEPTSGVAGADALAGEVNGPRVTVVAGTGREEEAFAAALKERLEKRGIEVTLATGHPHEVREKIKGATSLALSARAARWELFQGSAAVSPKGRLWPSFLKADNLLNIANQIAVVALIAVGLTFVIIAGGIDLSVGSLIALSAVVATLLIRGAAGAENAGAAGMILCSLAAIAVCAAAGLVSGAFITGFGLPPFVVTLAMMLVVGGAASILAEGQSIYQVPESFVRLGRGADLAGVPNAVLLMAALYVAGHLAMTRTIVGRYLYAVGGNPEAARLSGVPVRRVLLLAYAASGALAGLGGVVMASQLKSGAPTYGQMYELYGIAAVVVGGTSLSGGEGKIFGTLIGAFLIAVIQNGMNLTGVESYTQKVVLGAVILGAVLLDRLKKRRWFKEKTS